MIEPKAGEFRQKLGFKGTVKNEMPEVPGFVDIKVDCEGQYHIPAYGEQDPLILNNALSIGSQLGELKFEPESAKPESHDLESETAGSFNIEGKVKAEGYAAQEILEVKNR